jgi:hypothetical protein
MAQTLLVQEQALSVAQRRIKELEDELDRGRHTLAPERGPWDREDRHDRGGGFLAGAAQTALGVTGGVLLGSAIAGMFGGGTATAAEPQPAPEPSPDETAADLGGGDDGGDFGGFDTDGFDLGGDF